MVTQNYDVNVLDEHVLRGNAAVFKCHIPSFVADFVVVSSWLEEGKLEIYPDTNYGILFNLYLIKSRVKFAYLKSNCYQSVYDFLLTKVRVYTYLIFGLDFYKIMWR